MEVGLIIWLLVLATLNIGSYMFWLKVKDQTGTGGITDGFFFLIVALITFIADVSTMASLIF